MKRLRFVLACGTFFVSAISVCRAQDPAAVLEESIIKVVEKAEPSVVSIARYRPNPEDFIKNEHRAFQIQNGRLVDKEPPPSEMELLPNEFGAGVLIGPANSNERLVLTNYHVVKGGPIYERYTGDDGTELRVKFWDRRGCHGFIIAADPRSDLAVLKLKWEEVGAKPTDYPRLNWETAPAPRKGQFVVMLGNPYAIARDGSSSVSWGLISNLTRQPIMRNRGGQGDRDEQTSKSMLYRLGTVMQLDARLNLGTSGGPVLNLKGELIGLSTSLAAVEGYEQSTGFAIPIDALTRRIVRTLLAGQEVEYGMLGITPHEVSANDIVVSSTGLPQRSAAQVYDVQSGSPADVAGIKPGDIIVKINGEPIRGVSDLMRNVGLNAPESVIDVTVIRNPMQPGLKKVELVRVKLAKWYVMDDEGIIETSPRHAPWRGLTVDYPTARAKLRDIPQHGMMRPASDYRRVLVTRVAENSPAHTAGLEAGNYITQVNDTPVQTPAEFHAAVAKASGIVTLKLSDEGIGLPSKSGRLVQVRE